MPKPDPTTITPCSAQAIFDWLFTEGRRIESTTRFVQELAHRIIDNGGEAHAFHFRHGEGRDLAQVDGRDHYRAGLA